MKKVIKLLSIIVIVISINFVCYIKSNNNYQTVEKLTKKGNTIAFMLEQDDGTYQSTEELPTGYEFNQAKSQCNNGATPTWDSKTNSLRLSITKKNTSCFLYFDKGKSTKKLEELGLTISKEGCPVVDNQGIATITDIEGTNKLICSSADDDGETYYFRGIVDNNWVKFAGKLWRIIRINGDGTIRLIYAGTDESDIGDSNGKNAFDNKEYNKASSDNTYVGFTNFGGSTVKLTYEEAHNGSNPSDILSALNDWFTTSGLNSEFYIPLIDRNAGFCNDREKSNNNHGISSYNNLGYGSNATWYAPLDRVANENDGAPNAIEQKTTFNCSNQNRDLYTVQDAKKGNLKLTNPIGTISMDEVMYAGGYYAKANDGYWLYTGQSYWTMSPLYFSGSNASVFFVNNGGDINNSSVKSLVPGTRPVINLKADTKIITSKEDKKGTIDNPYIVEGAE